MRSTFIKIQDLALRLAFHPSTKIRIAFWIVVSFTALISLYSSFLFILVSMKMSGKTWELPSRVYSSSFSVYPNLDFDQIQLISRMKRLGYRQVKKVQSQGDFSLKSSQVEVYLKDFEYPDRKFKGFPIRISLQGRKISSLSRFSLEGGHDLEPLYLVEFEPELIAKFLGRVMEERELIKLKDAPPHLINSIIAIEDRRFYGHIGLDPRAIIRALLVDIKSRSLVQGGSTITQQLVKNLFLSRTRSFWRKFNEALMALIIEARYSKSRILEAYLNEIYLGQSGPVSISGVGAGAKFYFSKEVSSLSPSESAILAGLIRAPHKYSPHVNLQTALERRNLVLQRMLETGRISEEEYQEALAAKIEVSKTSVRAKAAPYFMDYLRVELKDSFSWKTLTSEGLKIFTAIDAQMQFIAERTLSRELSNLERWHQNLRRPDPQKWLQGCILAIQPQTGHIKAMVGGRDYSHSQLNRTFQVKRQPGSAFKPIVFAAGFEASPKDAPLRANTTFEDEPTEFEADGKKWAPKNYGNAYHGRVTARTALEKSLNIPTVALTQSIGLENVISTAKKLGIRSNLDPVLSLALGSFELSPMELAAAYCAFANGGIRPVPFSVIAVINSKGKTLTRKQLKIQASISPQTAFLLTNLLQGVLDRGTAYSAKAEGFYRPAAGKTGTTNDERDSWFVGYTPELLGIVWVGFDDNAPTHLTGAKGALPIWTKFMKASTSWQLYDEFEPPEGIVFRKIDRYTGYLATSGCPESINEAFLEGSEPKEYCSQHEPMPEPELTSETDVEGLLDESEADMPLQPSQDNEGGVKD